LSPVTVSLILYALGRYDDETEEGMDTVDAASLTDTYHVKRQVDGENMKGNDNKPG